MFEIGKYFGTLVDINLKLYVKDFVYLCCKYSIQTTHDINNSL